MKRQLKFCTGAKQYDLKRNDSPNRNGGGIIAPTKPVFNVRYSRWTVLASGLERAATVLAYRRPRVSGGGRSGGVPRRRPENSRTRISNRDRFTANGASAVTASQRTLVPPRRPRKTKGDGTHGGRLAEERRKTSRSSWSSNPPHFISPPLSLLTLTPRFVLLYSAASRVGEEKRGARLASGSNLEPAASHARLLG